MNAAGVSRRRFGQLVGGFFAALGIGVGPARASLRSRVVEVEVDGKWRELPGVVPLVDAGSIRREVARVFQVPERMVPDGVEVFFEPARRLGGRGVRL